MISNAGCLFVVLFDGYYQTLTTTNHDGGMGKSRLPGSLRLSRWMPVRWSLETAEPDVSWLMNSGSFGLSVWYPKGSEVGDKGN